MPTIPPCPERARAAGSLARRLAGRAAALGLVVLAAGLGACSSSRSKPEVEPMAIRVTWRDYRTGNLLELVSQSHTSKLELYSQKRDDAARKVQEDLYMQGLLEFLQLEGFDGQASAGRAPREGRDLWTQSIEVDRDGDVRHAAVGPRTPAAERMVFQKCLQGFLELYNATQAFQTVEPEEGTSPFKSSSGQPSSGKSSSGQPASGKPSGR